MTRGGGGGSAAKAHAGSRTHTQTHTDTRAQILFFFFSSFAFSAPKKNDTSQGHTLPPAFGIPDEGQAASPGRAGAEGMGMGMGGEGGVHTQQGRCTWCRWFRIPNVRRGRPDGLLRDETGRAIASAAGGGRGAGDRKGESIMGAQETGGGTLKQLESSVNYGG